MGKADSIDAEIAAALLGIHRERDRIFGPVIFSNVSWDIALHLCASQQGCTIDDLTSAFPAVSEALLLRWTDVLQRAGVVEGQSAGLYRLTDDARTKLGLIFGGLTLVARP